MVGLDNPLHIAMLLVVVLLVFGAKRLPEMGKSLGEGLRGFKDSVSGEHPAPSMLSEMHAAAPAETETKTETEAAAERAKEPVA
ncbi:MAG: twin-arginine translocase TatA/TatE family subunit [Solirubrobacteraceae bacterium]